jgi:malonyl-CoA O-methyltransferase
MKPNERHHMPLLIKQLHDQKCSSLPARRENVDGLDEQAGPVNLPTRDGYDVWSKIYDVEDNPLITLEEPKIHELLGDLRGRTIADIGCGTGRHAIRMAKAGARVTALDFSEGMLDKARSKPGSEQVEFVLHDLAESLPLPASEFDIVTCCLVVDHIVDLAGFFGELARISKADGSIVVSVMHPAMNLLGVQARFTDPDTGKITRPESQDHQVCDYVTAVARAGLLLDHISEHSVDHHLVEHSPRAAKYIGWPLLLLLRLKKMDP